MGLERNLCEWARRRLDLRSRCDPIGDLLRDRLGLLTLIAGMDLLFERLTRVGDITYPSGPLS